MRRLETGSFVFFIKSCAVHLHRHIAANVKIAKQRTDALDSI
jgi:hypothetical protein